MNDIKVSIICLTYNHEDFIANCLDSILAQECDFEYEIILHDDCSTDDSRIVINDYISKHAGKISIVRQNENQFEKFGLKNIILNLLNLCKGEFIAFCECDDYWINNSKLSKQVDVLESNPQLSLVSTGIISLDIHGLEDYKAVNSFVDFNFDLISGLFDNWYCQSLSVMIRKSLIPIHKLNLYSELYDTMLWYELLKYSSGYFIDQPMGVYRIHGNGMWNGKTEKEKIRFSLMQFYEIWCNNKDDRRVLMKLNEIMMSYRDLKNLNFFEKIQLIWIDLKINKNLARIFLYFYVIFISYSVIKY
jgi:glycosyltransferase involved in cell wall biosynthesis